MISTELAIALRETGLVWHPASGDRFQLDEPEFEADIFTVSEMTIEPREYPTGVILAFNGTTARISYGSCCAARSVRSAVSLTRTRSRSR